MRVSNRVTPIPSRPVPLRSSMNRPRSKGRQPIPLNHGNVVRWRSVPLCGPACCAVFLADNGEVLLASAQIGVGLRRSRIQPLRRDCSSLLLRRCRGLWRPRHLLGLPLFSLRRSDWPSAGVTRTFSRMPPRLRQPWRICGPGFQIPPCLGPAEGGRATESRFPRCPALVLSPHGFWCSIVSRSRCPGGRSDRIGAGS